MLNLASPASTASKTSTSRKIVLNDDTDADVDNDEASTVSNSNSHSSRRSLYTREHMCTGYDPNVESFFLNFPFQVVELYPEKVNFVISANKFHSKECAANCFFLKENSNNKINNSCNRLATDTFLQGKNKLYK
jgi:hypothetical protein